MNIKKVFLFSYGPNRVFAIIIKVNIRLYCLNIKTLTSDFKICLEIGNQHEKKTMVMYKNEARKRGKILKISKFL